MAQYLDKTGLTTLWTKIKNTFAPKSHTHKKSEITDLNIPTVNNPTITINQGGTKKGSFSLNQSGATTINLADNNTTYTAGAGLSLSSGAFSVKTGYTTSGKNYKVTTDSNGNLYVNVPWTDTNTNTWRPVVDNLTSTATDQSLSANQGKVLKSYIDTYFPRAKYGGDSYYSDVSNSFIGGVYNGPRTNDWEFLYRAEHRNGDGDGPNYVMEMVSNLTSDSSIYWRKKTGSSFTSFREIIDSNNIGSQNVNYANSAGSANSVAWGNVSGRPFSGTSFVSGNSSNGEHNANNAITNGHYYYNSNGPATSLGASYTDGALYVQSHSDAWAGQIAQDYRNGSLFVRGKNNGSWSSWKRIIDSDNIGSQNVNYANSAGSANSVAWGNVSGRPSSLPASDVYAWAKASSKPSYSWSEITSKPNILPYTPLNGGLLTVTTTSTWGVQTGSEIASFYDNAGGGLKFRKNCPSSGKMSMIIDGTVYVNEGNNKVIDTSNLSMSFSNGVLTITYNV